MESAASPPTLNEPVCQRFKLFIWLRGLARRAYGTDGVSQTNVRGECGA